MEPQQSPETTLNVPDRTDEATEAIDSVDTERPTLERLRPRRLQRIRRLPGALGGTSRRTRVVAAALLAVLLAGLLVLVVRALPPDIEVSTAKIGAITVAFTTSGTVQATTYDVTFATPGKVAEINVRVGQTVTAGQVLAKLDTTVLESTLRAAQARVRAAQTALSDAQTAQSRVQAQGNADLAAAYQQEQTALRACKRGDSACVGRAQSAYAAAQSRADAQNASALAAVNAAQSQLSVAQAEVQAAQASLDGATLTAPHAGVVAQIFGTVGSAAGPGSGARFIQLVDLNALQLVANVSANDIGSVQPQQHVRFIVPSLQGQTFLGTVDTVGPLGEQSGDTARYPVTVSVDMNSLNTAHLLPGMAATVTITTYSRIGVLVVPYSAVAFARAAGNTRSGGFLSQEQVRQAQQQADQLLLDYQSQGKADPAHPPTPGYVLKRTGDKWSTVPVLLGATDGHVYEVLSEAMPNSIKAGDKIVTAWRGGPVTMSTPTPATH